MIERLSLWPDVGRVHRGANGRFGSKADMYAAKRHVSFTPKSDIKCDIWNVRYGPKADIPAIRSAYQRADPEVTRRVEPLAKAAQEALDQFTQGMSEEQKRWAELAVKGDISEPTEFDLREYLLLRQHP